MSPDGGPGKELTLPVGRGKNPGLLLKDPEDLLTFLLALGDMVAGNAGDTEHEADG